MPRNPIEQESKHFRFRDISEGQLQGTVTAVRMSDDSGSAAIVRDDAAPYSASFVHEFKQWPGHENAAYTAIDALAKRLPNTGLWQAFECDIRSCIKLSSQVDELEPGDFHPRIWRPCNARFYEDNLTSRTDSQVALSLLEEMAREVVKVVEPKQRQLQAFGHRIRDLLMLACAEFENACRAVLKANNYRFGKKGYGNTKDYWHLKAAMRLDRYEMQLTAYPDLAPLQPFMGWERDRETDSLDWYDAYNAAKHSRSENFEKATLGHALAALAAAWTMHVGQFGLQTLREDSYLFRSTNRPEFGPGTGYLAPIRPPRKLSPRPFPFDSYSNGG